MSTVTEVSKIIDLDLSGIPSSKIKKAKKEVAGFLKNEVLRYIDRSISPVKGERRFKLLDKDYAEKEHNGNRISILQLDGDMLSAFDVKDIGANKLFVGIKGKEAPKADGHNQISDEAKNWAQKSGMPKRRFIPDENQTFKKDIMNKVNSILDNYRVAPDEEQINITIDSTKETPDEIGVSVADLFTENTIEAMLLAELDKL